MTTLVPWDRLNSIQYDDEPVPQSGVECTGRRGLRMLKWFMVRGDGSHKAKAVNKRKAYFYKHQLKFTIFIRFTARIFSMTSSKSTLSVLPKGQEIRIFFGCFPTRYNK
ncbi:hypothetical protein YC2023_036981 [Brassica napus]